MPVEVQDRVHRAVEQPAVVADDEHGVRIAREEGLEPDRALEVEVVGRLVEQQHVGPREEHRGQRHPHPPAAGELGAGAAPGPRRRSRGPFRIDAGARLGRMRVDVGEAGVDLADPVRRRSACSASASSAARSMSAASTVSIRLSRVAGASCATPPMRARFGTSISPPSSAQLAADQPEERGLAAAVAPDESDLVPGRDRAPRRRRRALALDREADVAGTPAWPPMWRAARVLVNGGRPSSSQSRSRGGRAQTTASGPTGR